MIHDIFVPCRIGNYYLHTKRILSIDVTPVMIQAVVFVYSGSSIVLQQKEIVILKDSSQQGQINGLKKIVELVGKFDEVVTNCASLAIIFKELELPFIGRQNLQMVIPFEIENQLPFALDQAIIDFVVTSQNFETKTSKVFVAALRKSDIQQQYDLFAKADISLSSIVLDIFGLYTLYNIGLVQHTDKKIKTKQSLRQKITIFRQKLYRFITRQKPSPIVSHQDDLLLNIKPTRSDVIVDIQMESIKVLYMKDGVLQAVRIIPFAILDSINRLSKDLNISVAEIVEDVYLAQPKKNFMLQMQDDIKKIYQEVSRTLLYFAQQDQLSYLQPSRMIFVGLFSNSSVFAAQIKSYFGSIAQVINIHDVLQATSINLAQHVLVQPEQTSLLAANILLHTSADNTLLHDVANKQDNAVMVTQLFVMICVSVILIGGVYWKSYNELSTWEMAYNASRKQFVQTIEQQMSVDLKGEKNIKIIVQKAQDLFKREHELWFSFMKQKETSVLQYLQDLSLHIDRASIGLDLESMHLDYQKVTMKGSVKNFAALETFEEELLELKLLKLTQKPRELSWTVQLQPKDMAKEQA